MLLSAYPLTHHFVAYFVWIFHPDAKKLFSRFEEVLNYIAIYQVENYCRCGECGTFYLSCGTARNLFATDEMFCEGWDKMLFLPKAYKDDKLVDFEIVSGINKNIQKTLPFYKELLNVYESKKPSSLSAAKANLLIKTYFNKHTTMDIPCNKSG